jgi:hypothetical protein
MLATYFLAIAERGHTEGQFICKFSIAQKAKHLMPSTSGHVRSFATEEPK